MRPTPRRLARLLTHGWLFSALSLASCCAAGGGADGGVDAGSPLPSPALDPLAACHELAQAQAALEVRCGRLDPVDQARFAASLCAGGFALREAEFDAGTLAYSAIAVACEVAYRKTEPCNLPPTADTGCGQLAWGALVESDSCDDPLSCQSGLFCERLSPSDPCGSCAQDPGLQAACGPGAYGAPCAAGLCDGSACRVAVGQGQQCAMQAAVCLQGLSCQTGICQEPAAAGATCEVDSDCEDGLFCQGNTGSSICTARCQPKLPCDAGVCDFGSALVQADGGGPPVCEPFVAGGACLLGPDGGSCLEAEWCGPDGGCQSQPGSGDPCTVGGVPCLVGGCQKGSCQPLPAGQSCVQDLDCVSGRCGGGGIAPVCATDCAL